MRSADPCRAAPWTGSYFSLCCNLLITGHAQLQDGKTCNQDKEQNSLGLCNTAGAGILAVEGVVDVQSHHFGGVHRAAVGIDDVGQTAGQSQVLVEQFEGVGQSQEGADGDGGGDHGQLDLEQSSPGIGAVDSGSFQNIVGDSGSSTGEVSENLVPSPAPSASISATSSLTPTPFAGRRFGSPGNNDGSDKTNDSKNQDTLQSQIGSVIDPNEDSATPELQSAIEGITASRLRDDGDEIDDLFR